MREVNVSDEYLDSLCEWMVEWVKKDSSLTIPQFLAHKGIGYPYFKYFVWRSPKVANTFEVVKAILANRWVSMGLTKDDLPPHRAKMLMKFLRLYDSHALDVEEESRKAIAEAEVKADMRYFAEKYDREQLEQPYRGFYEDNVNKRRGSKEAE